VQRRRRRLRRARSRGEPALTVARLSIEYEQHCEAGPKALFGEVRIGEPGPPGNGFAAPTIVQWPALDVGAAGQAVPVSFVATQATRVAAVSLIGAQAGDYPVRVDECTGVSLAAGDVCHVFLRFAPAAAGPSTAMLRFTDDAGMSFDVPVQGFAIGGHTRVTLHSDRGDFVGGGVDRSFTPASAGIVLGYEATRSDVQFVVDGPGDALWDG
jgi:hypothetical protein